MADCSTAPVLGEQKCRNTQNTPRWALWWRCNHINSLFIGMPLVEIPTQAGLICSWRTLQTSKIQRNKTNVASIVLMVCFFPSVKAWKIASFFTAEWKHQLLLLLHGSKWFISQQTQSVNNWKACLSCTELWIPICFEQQCCSIDPLMAQYILSGCWPVVLCTEHWCSAWFDYSGSHNRNTLRWKMSGSKQRWCG